MSKTKLINYPHLTLTFSKWDSKEKRVARCGEGNLKISSVKLKDRIQTHDEFGLKVGFVIIHYCFISRDLAMISFNCFSFAFLLGKFTAANSFSTA